MFCITDLNDPDQTSFKVTDEDFEELSASGIFMPAPHLQRAKWVKVMQPYSLKLTDWKGRIATSYALVRARLPKKVQGGLAS